MLRQYHFQLSNWTYCLCNFSLILSPSSICFNISAYFVSSLNLWLMFKKLATLMEFFQKPEFLYKTWFSFIFTGGIGQKSLQMIIDYQQKNIFWWTTFFATGKFLLYIIGRVFNLFVLSLVENKILWSISILTGPRFSSFHRIFFDFDFENAALCKVTPK